MQRVQAEVVSVADKQISFVPLTGPYSDKLYGMPPPKETQLHQGDTIIVELDSGGLSPTWHYV